MGAGNIPYASGAVQWRPDTEPPRQHRAPQMPPLPTGGATPPTGTQTPPQGQQGVQTPPGLPQGAMQIDPYQIMQFARQLMDRYRVGYGQARRYRG